MAKAASTAIRLTSVIGTFITLEASTCLPDGNPASERRNLTLGGSTTPLQLVVHPWSSSELMVGIYKILVEEKLGYDTRVNVISSSGQTMYALAGCQMDDSNCHVRGPVQYHLDMELWDAYATNQIQYLQENHAERFPDDLGSTGYDGDDVLIVSSDRVFKKAWSLDELPLDFYRSYNTSRFNSTNLFARYMDIPSQKLAPCNETQLANGLEIQNYLRQTQDMDGVVQDRGGNVVARCHDNSWWISPACRDMPERCVPLITGGNGWGLNTWMQKATIFNMPLILATAAKEHSTYYTLPLEYDIIAHWWVPDAAFISNNPVQIIFPQHNPDEWKRGNKATAGQKQRISKRAYAAISQDAPFAHRLASRIEVSIQTMDTLLTQVKENGGLASSTACAWLLTNEDFWKPWIPDASECPVGQGIIDEVGEFVTDKNRAAGCKRCIPGMRSAVLKVSGIRICQQCAPGHFNNAIGAEECTKCRAGRFTTSHGKDACDRCPIGRFRGDSGNGTLCVACPSSTTTHSVGAESVEDCACEDGTYMSDQGTCELCPAGVLCKHGRLPLLKPKYMMMPNASRSSIPLQIFMCGSEARCPGQPHSINDPICAEFMYGLNCASCDEGYFLQGNSKCKPCGKGSGASVPLVALVVFFLCGFFLAAWNNHNDEVEAAESVLASVTLGITLAYLQSLGIFAVIEFNWPTLLQDFFSVIRLILFDFTDVFTLPCDYKRSFQATYVMNMLVPIVLLGFFLAWYWIYRFLVYATTLTQKRRKEEQGKEDRSWIRRYNLNEVANSIGLIVQAIYLPFVFMTVSMVECFRSNADMMVLRTYPAVECGSGEHLAMIPAIALGILMYIVGVFVLFAYLIWTATSRYREIEFQTRIRFLVFKFRPQCWWYGLALIFRSLLLGLVNVVAPTSGYHQFYILTFVLIASLAAHMSWWPYLDQHANIAEAVELGLLVAMVGIGSTFIDDPDIRSPESIKALSILLFLICMCCFLALFLVFSYALYCIWKPDFTTKTRACLVEKLIPKVERACDAFKQSSDRTRSNLLAKANYLDCNNLSSIASWLLLELKEDLPVSLHEKRLCRFSNVRSTMRRNRGEQTPQPLPSLMHTQSSVRNSDTQSSQCTPVVEVKTSIETVCSVLPNVLDRD